MDVSLLIRLIDQFTGPAQKIRRTAQGLGEELRASGQGLSDAFKQGFSIENIEQATRNAEQKLGKARSRLLGALGQALSLGLPVKLAADFETEMNRVRALTNASGEDFESLRQQALELGRTTQFTTRQAADAQGFLAMAGFKTNQILEAMPGTLQLAASAQIDLAKAADIVTNVLTGYNKNGNELGHVNDVLVKAFTSANTDLLQLAEAMKYAGPVASSAGVHFEETTAAIALMGNAGIQASMAGTGLRGAITRMLSPTKAVKEAMEDANLKFTDTKGRLLPLVDIIKQLEPHADDTGLMMKLFGQRAGPAMMALVSQGSDALTKLNEELEHSAGTAERVSKVQMEGFNGMLKEMQSASEGTAIALGTLLFPSLIELGHITTDLLNKLTDYAGAHPVLTAHAVKLVAALTGMSIAGRVLAFGFAGMRMGLIPLLGFFLKFNKAGRNVSTGWRLMRLGAAGAQRAFSLFASTSRVVATGMRGVASGALEAGRQIIATQGRARTMATALRRVMAGSWMISMGFEIMDDLGRTPEERLLQMNKNIQRWQKIEKDVEQSWFGQMWQGAKDRANSLMGLEQGVVPAEALAAWGNAKAKQFYDVGTIWMNSLWDGMRSLWAEIATWFDTNIAWLKGLLDFDLNINWPEPPAWLTYLMELAGSGISKAKEAIGSGAAGALLPRGIDSGEAPLTNVMNPLGDTNVKQTIEVVNGQTPNLSVGPIHITGVSDPNATAKAVGAEVGRIGAQYMSRKSGALHGGTE